jgi:hypothetical protein
MTEEAELAEGLAKDWLNVAGSVVHSAASTGGSVKSLLANTSLSSYANELLEVTG